MSYLSWFKTLVLTSAAIAGYSSATYLIGKNPFNTIPVDRKVKIGYVRPSKLEIELKDLEGDGTNETLLKYDGKSYLLKLNHEGRPIVRPYRLRDAEIIKN